MSRLFESLFGSKEVRILILGLDNAGVADEAGQHPKQVVTIKMWDYDRLNPSSGPICLKNIRTPFTHTKDNQQQEQQGQGLVLHRVFLLW